MCQRKEWLSPAVAVSHGVTSVAIVAHTKSLNILSETSCETTSELIADRFDRSLVMFRLGLIILGKRQSALVRGSAPHCVAMNDPERWAR
jgi:hypothetical protein